MALLRTTFFLVLAVLFVGHGAARAEERPLTFEEARRVEQLVAEARELRTAGDFPAAIERVRAALTLHPVGWLYYNLARLYEDAGMFEDALVQYDQCLLSDPDPKVYTRATAGRARVLARLSGRLAVEVDPDGSAVYVDGEARGTTPLAPLVLPAGVHVVRVERDGCPQQEREVVVGGAGTTTTARFVMQSRTRPSVELLGDASTPADGVAVEMLDEDAPRPSGPRAGPWSWVALGSGVALLAGGTTLYVLGEADYARVRDAGGYGEAGAVVEMSARRARALVDSGEAKQTVGAVMLGLGSAAVATSIVLFVLDETVWRAPVTSGAAARPMLRGGPDGAVLGVQGAF